ncbi:YjjW family glycine radical enzyme activase [Vibrio sp. 99-8-1]|uniref:YjjW family glycine radical enzyme activase n=1 Tax=Vibrio sp. 99-8-1 TaxID=2607602 RepID=UPI001493B380|nr:YjjW family glycine radical enzyme activase [Vibrio sp. 99-8-1]NOI67337.1 YjjW family glycine radical enzyme activase [Vibrio sp. 99-8-1]
MSKIQATVSKILTFSCVDGPGNRLVIFLQGCNFNCLNCHNPHTINLCDHCAECVAVCPEKALSMHGQQVHWQASLCTECDACIEVCPRNSTPKTKQYSVDEMMALIRTHSPFLSGITVTGGEATLQLPFIVALFTALKQDVSTQHLTCMVDSNGSLSRHGWQKLLPVIDGAMIDLKAWQKETHLRLTNRENSKVIQTIQLLEQNHKLYEVRLLLIPNQTDLQTEVDALAQFLTKRGADVRIKINAFQQHGVTGEAEQWPSCSEESVKQFAAQLEQRGVNNLILPNVYL